MKDEHPVSALAISPLRRREFCLAWKIPLHSLTPGLIESADAGLLEAGFSKRAVEQPLPAQFSAAYTTSMGARRDRRRMLPSDMTGRLEQLRAVGPAWRDA